MRRERRRVERFESKLFAEIESLAHEPVGRGVVVDIGLNGLGVMCEADLEAGQVYICHVEAPLRFKIRVMSRNSSGQMKRYGVQFVGQGFLDKLLFKKVLKGSRQTRKL